jgi:hypothetical protein
VVLGGRLRDRIEGGGQPLRASVAGVEATQARSSGELPLQWQQAKVADLGRDVQVERGNHPRQFFAACIETAAKEASRRCDSQPLASRLLRRRRAAAAVLGGRRRDGGEVETAARDAGSSGGTWSLASRLLRRRQATAAAVESGWISVVASRRQREVSSSGSSWQPVSLRGKQTTTAVLGCHLKNVNQNEIHMTIQRTRNL